jgi:hypothetical protein
MKDVHQPGRILEQNGTHGNKMEPQEHNGISKEEILQTWKVTRMEWNGIEWYHSGNNQKIKNVQG